MAKRPPRRPDPLTDREADLAFHREWTALEALKWRRTIAAAKPEGWADIERDNPVRRPRAKITLLLDADVATFFRMQGQGWHARVNAVLRAFMYTRLAQEAETAKDGPLWWSDAFR